MNAIDETLTCHCCGYSLRGKSMQDRCSECGTSVAESLREPKERRLRAYEDKLLVRERGHRANRSGALTLAGMDIVFLVLITFGPLSRTSEDTQPLIITAAAMAPFWLAIAYCQHARLKHIQSIKMSRAKEEKFRSHPASASAAEGGANPPHPQSQQ